MNKIMIAITALSLSIASVASAETFTFGKLTGSFAEGDVEIYSTFSEATGEISTLGVDAVVYEGQLQSYDLTGRVGFETSVEAPISYVYGEIEASREIGSVEAYGIANVAYYGVDGYFTKGSVVYTPTIGVRDDFTEKFSGYTEVSYVYDEDFAPVFGYAEVGVEYDLNDRVSVAPSVRQYFDGLEETNLLLEAKYTF